MNEIFRYKLITWGDYIFTVGDLASIIIIILVARLLLLIVKVLVEKRYRKDAERSGRKLAITKLFGYVIWTFTILIILQAAGLKITLILAGSAALLVGIGLGLQQTFNDFISGFILLIDRTIEVNDVIELDNMVARVKHIGIRTSIVVNRDDISVIIPNSRITGNNVINWSHTKKQSRFHILVGVAYGADEELVRKVLLECASEHIKIHKDPAPFVRLEEFGNSSINFGIYFWVSEIFRVESTKSDLRFSIVKKLRENNISIPFPQMDLYIKKLPGQD